ncbi:MAG: hypothetical protein ACTTHG_00585 [Treponemataceae bacterium]
MSKKTVKSGSSEKNEYERAIGNLTTDEVISIDTFKNDKAMIFKTIRALDGILQENNYSAWLKYITPSSISYWSQKGNLKSVSSRLPVKNITLRSLEDYFKFIFKPSRVNKKIDEIRYISSTSIKAVQTEKNQDIVFYNFTKINGKWLIELDRFD